MSNQKTRAERIDNFRQQVAMSVALRGIASKVSMDIDDVKAVLAAIDLAKEHCANASGDWLRAVLDGEIEEDERL